MYPSVQVLSGRRGSVSGCTVASECPVSECTVVERLLSKHPVSLSKCPVSELPCLHVHLYPMSTHSPVRFEPAVSCLTPHSGLQMLPLCFSTLVLSIPMLCWRPFSTNLVICCACYTVHRKCVWSRILCHIFHLLSMWD